MFIIECKHQQTRGSVDKKLCACDFEKKQYEKLLPNMTVEYIFFLGDWFKNKKYKDELDYIRNVGCHYFFENQYQELLELLGLPICLP